MKILLVEDEKQLADALVVILKNEKHSIDAVYDGESGLEYGLTGIYDLILLDIMLPKLNGLEVLKTLRKKTITTPVIMLTALSTEKDKVLGLDIGADDYLAKPFSVPELLARIRALARRKGEYIIDNTLTFGNLHLNLNSMELYTDVGKIKLSLKEFEIIKYLLEKPKVIATREDLLLKIWGFDNELESNNIEVYISFLRKKLAHIKSSTAINTVRGVGYELEDLCSQN